MLLICGSFLSCFGTFDHIPCVIFLPGTIPKKSTEWDEGNVKITVEFGLV